MAGKKGQGVEPGKEQLVPAQEDGRVARRPQEEGKRKDSMVHGGATMAHAAPPQKEGRAQQLSSRLQRPADAWLNPGKDGGPRRAAGWDLLLRSGLGERADQCAWSSCVEKVPAVSGPGLGGMSCSTHNR